MGRAALPWDAQVVTRGLQQIVGCINHLKNVILVDVTKIKSGVTDMNPRHTGLHPMHMYSIVHNPNFPLLCIRVLDEMRVQQCNATQDMTLVFVSRSGRHRAAAFAKLFQELVLSRSDMSLGRFSPLADWWGPQTCSMCIKCEWWTRRWKLRNQALDLFLKMCADRSFCQKCHDDWNADGS